MSMTLVSEVRRFPLDRGASKTSDRTGRPRIRGGIAQGRDGESDRSSLPLRSGLRLERLFVLSVVFVRGM
jgi:hypothetical protein